MTRIEPLRIQIFNDSFTTLLVLIVFYWSLLYEYFILTQSSDVRLQDSQERMLAYERRSNEHTKLIAELTQKVRGKRNCQVTEQTYSNLLAHTTDCFNFFPA